MHWARWKRLGTTTLPVVVPKGCSIDGCAGKHKGLGYCTKHFQAFKRTGNPEGSGYLKGKDNPAWKGDDVTYHGAHRRCDSLWGKASENICIDCGGKASEWSYDHTDPNPLTEERVGVGTWEGNSVLEYSPYPEFYAARCHPCHTSFDKKVHKS